MRTMEAQSVLHNTFVIERSFAIPPERVFAAFAEPARKRRWYAEGDSHLIENFEMDFRIGGAERSSYRLKVGPFKGFSLSNDGRFEDIVPNQRIVMSTTMSMGENHISSSLITFEFVPTNQGTEMIFTHQGAFYENSGGPEMRKDGWQLLFDRLAAELAANAD